jgi:hypothetical protein
MNVAAILVEQSTTKVALYAWTRRAKIDEKISDSAAG